MNKINISRCFEVTPPKKIKNILLKMFSAKINNLNSVINNHLVNPSFPIQAEISHEIIEFGNSALIALTKSSINALMYSPVKTPPVKL